MAKTLLGKVLFFISLTFLSTVILAGLTIRLNRDLFYPLELALFILLLGAGFLFMRPVQMTIRSLIDSTDEVVKGNINVLYTFAKNKQVAEKKKGFHYHPIYAGEKEDIGILAINLAKMFKGWRRYNAATFQTAELLKNNIGTISSSSEQISSGANDQAVQAQNLLQNIEELAGIAKNSDDRTRSTADLALETDQKAREGQEVIDQLINNIKSISTSFEQLKVSSQKINQFTGIIEDIAGQTNLLALNAAIEAARAGEHGRGFSVVAEEVRKLAEGTASSTKGISDLVLKIQTDTDNATASISQGLELAGLAEKSFKSIMDRIIETVSAIETIKSLVSEQSEQINKMLSGVESIASISEETAASIQEVASSISQLQEGAASLVQRAGVFEILQED
ncbi:MAG: methyl-accepting chemotaxis protein [Bacillota bacterium]